MIERRALRDTPAGLEWINPSVRAHAYLAIPGSVRRALHEGILTELLARGEAGLKVPGLELAWHAMRSGKALEGSAYLLRGAREALLCGAAHDAEMALRSGMSGVDPSLHGDAELCLGEVLLELGRPDEALDLLGPLAALPSTRGTMATLLQIKGLMDVVEGHPEETAENERVARLLCSIATTSTDLSIRARAVAVTSSLPEGRNAADSSMRLVEIGNQISIADLQPADAVGLLVALAKNHYRSRNLRPCEELLVEAIRVADSAGLRNRAYLSALNGLGAVACAQGRYQEGLDLSLQLCGASEAIGNKRLATLATGNAALCLLRVGRYTEALEWAGRLDSLPSTQILTRLIQLDVQTVASRFVGDRQGPAKFGFQAQQVAEKDQQRAVRRWALLIAADGLWLSGDTRGARAMAKAAIELGVPTVEDPGRTGHYSRWLGAIEVAMPTDVARVCSILREALRAPLDALDKVEVLGALASLGQIWPKEQVDLSAGIGMLPPASREQLSVMGVLGREQARDLVAAL